MRRARQTPYEKFIANVDFGESDTDCWVWTRATSSGGYGYFSADGKMQHVHRWLLGYLRGKPLTSDEVAAHHCDNRPCCNPAHIYVATQAQNVRDMVERGRGNNQKKTHCKRGHEFNEANTYFSASKGKRLCRPCRQEKARAKRAASKNPTA